MRPKTLRRSVAAFLPFLGVFLATPAAQAHPQAADPCGAVCANVTCPERSDKHPEPDAPQYTGLVGGFSREDLRCLRCSLCRFARSTCKPGEACTPATNVAKAFFRDIYVPGYPKLIAYLFPDEKGIYQTSEPVLLWKGKAIRFLQDLHNVWLVLFSEAEIGGMKARLETLHAPHPNPVSGILGKLNVSVGEKDEPKQVEAVKDVEWHKVISDPNEPALYYSIVGFTIGRESVGRLNLSAPPEESEPKGATITWKGKEEKTGEISIEGGDKRKDKPVPTSFRSVFTVFTNSGGNYGAASLALGPTLGADESVLGPEQTHVNAYVCLKGYLMRPRLRPGVAEGRVAFSHRWSLGLLVGTNVRDDPFKQVLVGLSAGHLFGRGGLVGGYNFIEPSSGGRRKGRPFIGLEYTF